MSTCRDAVRAADYFLAALVGVRPDHSMTAEDICPGFDKAWGIAKCGKPGPHAQHRGDEPPTYDR